MRTNLILLALLSGLLSVSGCQKSTKAEALLSQAVTTAPAYAKAHHDAAGWDGGTCPVGTPVQAITRDANGQPISPLASVPSPLAAAPLPGAPAVMADGMVGSGYTPPQLDPVTGAPLREFENMSPEPVPFGQQATTTGPTSGMTNNAIGDQAMAQYFRDHPDAAPPVPPASADQTQPMAGTDQQAAAASRQQLQGTGETAGTGETPADTNPGPQDTAPDKAIGLNPGDTGPVAYPANPGFVDTNTGLVQRGSQYGYDTVDDNGNVTGFMPIHRLFVPSQSYYSVNYGPGNVLVEQFNPAPFGVMNLSTMFDSLQYGTPALPAQDRASGSLNQDRVYNDGAMASDRNDNGNMAQTRNDSGNMASSRGAGSLASNRSGMGR